MEEIKEGQKVDFELVDRLVLFNQSKKKDFKVDENGVIRFRDRICASDVPELYYYEIEKI